MADAVPPVFAVVALTLDRLGATDLPALLAAQLLAVDPGYPVAPRAAGVLRELELVDAEGRMHDVTREAVLAWQEEKPRG